MAAIENLEILVEVDISEALASLDELKDELRNLSQAIDRVDRRGTEGISINTHVESITDDLAQLRQQIRQFEETTEIDINTDVGQTGAFTGGLTSRVVSAGDIGAGGGAFDNLEKMIAKGVTNAQAISGAVGDAMIGGGGGSGGGGLFSQMKNLRRSFSELKKRLENFDLRMSDVHNAMASLIPLLLLFVGVVPTAVASLYTLAAAAATAAGALAAIGGLGLLGAAGPGREMPSGQQIKEQLNQIVNAFWEAFAPLAERLAPVFEDAMDGLEKFFQAIAAQGDALMALTDEMRAFGGFLMDFFPQALRTLSAVLEALAPLFGQMGQFLKENFQPIMKDLVSITLEAAPALGNLAIKLGQVAMFLARAGEGFAIVASAVIDLLGVFGALLNLLGITDRQLGLIVGGVLALASAALLANNTLISMAAKGIFLALRGLGILTLRAYAAASGVGFLSGTAIMSAITSLLSFTGGLIMAAASLLGFSISAWQAAVAAAAFWSAVTIGMALPLLATITSMAASFMGLSGSIDQATSSLRDFNRVAGKTSGGEFNPYAPDSGASQSGAQTGSSGSQSGGMTINYESSGDPNEDQSNLDKTVWRANRTSGDT